MAPLWQPGFQLFSNNLILIAYYTTYLISLEGGRFLKDSVTPLVECNLSSIYTFGLIILSMEYDLFLEGVITSDNFIDRWKYSFKNQSLSNSFDIKEQYFILNLDMYCVTAYKDLMESVTPNCNHIWSTSWVLV